MGVQKKSKLACFKFFGCQKNLPWISKRLQSQTNDMTQRCKMLLLPVTKDCMLSACLQDFNFQSHNAYIYLHIKGRLMPFVLCYILENKIMSTGELNLPKWPLK